MSQTCLLTQRRYNYQIPYIALERQFLESTAAFYFFARWRRLI